MMVLLKFDPDPGCCGQLAQVLPVANVSEVLLFPQVHEMVELWVGCVQQGKTLLCPAVCGQSSAAPGCIAVGIVCSNVLGDQSLAPSHGTYQSLHS